MLAEGHWQLRVSAGCPPPGGPLPFAAAALGVVQEVVPVLQFRTPPIGTEAPGALLAKKTPGSASALFAVSGEAAQNCKMAARLPSARPGAQGVRASSRRKRRLTRASQFGMHGRSTRASRPGMHGRSTRDARHGIAGRQARAPYSSAVSSQMVKGPSFTSSTCMWAPKTPRPTCSAPRSASASSQKRS